MSSIFGSGSTTAPQSSEEIKQAVLRQLQQETAMTNARALIGKINKHCFKACVPTPGSSLSTKENTCLSDCMDKYIAMWNVTSKTYIARVNVETKRMGGQDAAAIASMASGLPESGGGILG
ncbi:Mitochondrial intermembrane space translocase subunit Tim13 [Penicillium sp. DV-2018c]|nr:Mitochondrial intermembrane space translocase subunit Tim13 [Penicillium sp. DV-2018c]